MFTLFMMILSSLVTLYFSRPGFKKAVKYFFSTTDTLSASPKENVDAQVPTLDQPVRRESDLGWRAWTKEDAAEQEWTEQDEEDDGQRTR
jgi:hypothetical protein